MTALILVLFSATSQGQNTISNSADSICINSSPGTISGNAVGGLLGYFWEKSTSSATSGFSIIPSSFSQNYDPGVLTQTTWFVRVATFLILPLSYSNVVQITVSDSASASFSYAASPYCYNSGTATVTLSGTPGGTFSSTPSGASVNSADGSVDLAASSPGDYTVTYSVAASAGCPAFNTTGEDILINPNVWTGKVSSDWGTSGNWATAHNNGCPDLTILAGVNYQPLLSSATVSLQDLILDSGANLTLQNSILQISGSITGKGTIDASQGTIEMNGTSAQSIPSGALVNNSLKSLIIGNSSDSGVSLDGPVDLYDSLTYSGTGETLKTNGYLTLKSSDTLSASVGNMTGDTLCGNVTVERYLKARKGWRLLSVPTHTSQTISQAWQEGCGAGADCLPGFGTQITGPAGTAGGFDAASSYPSMKTYDPASGTYLGVSSTNTTAINTTGGYMIFVRGDRSVTTAMAAATPTILRTEGTLYTGTQPTINVPDSDFAVIGNPYASALDVRNISKTGMKDFFYLWDPLLGGTYGYGGFQTLSCNGSGDFVITPGGGSYGSNGSICNTIQSGQAFLIQATSSGGSVTMDESAKTSGSSLVNAPVRAPSPTLTVSLLGMPANDSIYKADGFIVNYGSNFSNGVDDQDALKSYNSTENLSVKRGRYLLVVERRHTINKQDTIPFHLSGLKIQHYRFKINAAQFKQPGLKAYLTDRYLLKDTPLNINGSTTYDFDISRDKGSYVINRFSIILAQRSTIRPSTSPVFRSIIAYQKGNGIKIEWMATNVMNIRQYQVEKFAGPGSFSVIWTSPILNNEGDTATFEMTDLKPVEGVNDYRIKCITDNGISFYSPIKAGTFHLPRKENIMVFPNPVTSAKIQFQINNEKEGNYLVRVIDQVGNSICSREFHLSPGCHMLTCPMKPFTPGGIYEMEVVTPENQIKDFKVLYSPPN